MQLKQHFALILLLVPLFPWCGCGESIPAAVAPSLVVSPTEFDLGTIPIIPNNDGVTQFPFKLKNVGPQAVVISAINPGCKCLTVSLPDKPIPPGGEISLMMELRPKEPGIGTGTMELTTSDPAQPFVRVRVRWLAAAPFRPSQDQFNVGRLQIGQSKTQTITFERQSFAPQGAALSLKGSSPQAQLTGELNADTLTVTIQAGQEPGPQSGTVTVSWGERECDQLHLPVHWEVRDAVWAEPDTVYVSRESGAPVAAVLSVYSGTEQAPELADWKLVPEIPGATLETVSRNNTHLELTLKLQVPAADSVQTHTLQLQMKQPVDRMLEVPILLDGRE